MCAASASEGPRLELLAPLQHTHEPYAAPASPPRMFGWSLGGPNGRAGSPDAHRSPAAAAGPPPPSRRSAHAHRRIPMPHPAPQPALMAAGRTVGHAWAGLRCPPGLQAVHCEHGLPRYLNQISKDSLAGRRPKGASQPVHSLYTAQPLPHAAHKMPGTSMPPRHPPLPVSCQKARWDTSAAGAHRLAAHAPPPPASQSPLLPPLLASRRKSVITTPLEAACRGNKRSARPAVGCGRVTRSKRYARGEWRPHTSAGCCAWLLRLAARHNMQSTAR